jgi:hypothetical protein
MIIAIVHFGDGHVKPQLYDDDARMTDWHRAKKHANQVSVPIHLQITKIEVSKPLPLTFHYFNYNGRKIGQN